MGTIALEEFVYFYTVMETADIYKLLDERRRELGLSQVEVGRLAFQKEDNSALQNIRRGASPSIEKLASLSAVLGLEMYFGPKRSEFVPAQTQDALVASNQTLPHHGMASCSTQGWADDDLQREPIPRPAWVSDDTAFWVSTTGVSMEQEGIRAGDFCIVSPGRAPRVGDRVWMKEASMDGRVAIKRLTKLTADRAYLRGWLPPSDGVQKSFDEERPITGIASMHPVIGVYRGRFGTDGVDVEYVHDPRKGTDARQDGLVPVSLLDGGWPGQAFPKALAFPDQWLSAHGLKFDQVVLVGIADKNLAPTYPKGTVALIDTSKRDIESKETYALRNAGKIIVRRVEKTKGGTLILSGNNTECDSTLVAPKDLGDIEVIGRMVWGGFRSVLAG